MRWILNGPMLEIFANDPGAQRFFAGSKPFAIRRKNAWTPLPAAWEAVTVRSFTSCADIERALAREAIGPGVGAILYDNEGWTFTPEVEKRDVAGFTARAAHLVRTRGLAFIAAPAVDLTRTLAPLPEPRYDAYLRLGIAADSARDADVFVIQAQGSERNLARYRGFVEDGARQARAANPRVTILAGISTNPNGQRVTAETILAAIAATRATVDGYWFNVPKPGPYCSGCTEFRPDMALDVVRRLAERER